MKRVGVGLDYPLLEGYPFGLHGIVEKFGDLLSHVSVVGITTTEEAASFVEAVTGLPIVHHLSNVAPAGVGGLNRETLCRLRRLTSILDALWCVEDIGIWTIGSYDIPYFAPPVLCEDVLEQTVKGVREVRFELPVPFAAEIPSCSFVTGDMGIGTFFQRLISEAQCKMVLDVSHLFSYAVYTGLPFAEVLRSLPLSAVVEIHIAGGNIHPRHKWRYRDTHAEPIIPEIFDILREAIGLCANLRGVTYEIGDLISGDVISSDLERIDRLCESEGFIPRLRVA